MIEEMSTQELQQLLEQGEKVSLIDVREQDEWEENHIKEAKLLPLSEFEARYHELDEAEQPIVLICRGGGRSGRAAAFLHSQGYEVINVEGGMLAWEGQVVVGK